MLRWHIDECSTEWISGWIDDDGPVEKIYIAINDRVVAEVTPDKYREDLEAAGFGDGRRSFSFKVSEFLADPINTITVARGNQIIHTNLLAVGKGQEADSRSRNVQEGGARPPNPRFLQTADPEIYKPILDLTSRTVIEYCRRHRYKYQSTVGICRGHMPWHATFNRIPLLQSLLKDDFDGWVCYLDADAFISDLDFDLTAFLQDKNKLAFIAASDRPHDRERPYWLVNAGVFLVNLGSTSGRKIIMDWASAFDAITDERFEAERKWSDTIDDQSLLQGVLKELPNGPEVILTLRGEPNLINYPSGRFIRQILRSQENFTERLESIRVETDRILGTNGSSGAARISSEKIDGLAAARAIYRALLFREPTADEVAAATGEVASGELERALRERFMSEEFQQQLPRFLAEYNRAVQVRHSKNLTELANEFGSDKGTRCGEPPHKYTYVYDLAFTRYREQVVDLLELGLAAGGPEVGGFIERRVDAPSARMWLEYFPAGRIFGFDISDFSHIQHPRFTFIRGDLGSETDLARLANAAPGYDVIIDDASHASHHQQLAFKYLFPRLRSGGTYIIEDLHWQSPFYENHHEEVPATSEFMISFFEREAYLPNVILSNRFMAEIRQQIRAFSWFPSFNGDASPPKLILITKQ